MARSEFAVSDLLDALRVGEGTDLVTRAGPVGAPAAHRRRGDREDRCRPVGTDTGRVTHRNGTRPKVLSTQAGDLALAIPKRCKGSFFPGLLEPRRRIDQALYAVVMEAYVNGVSTRSVDDIGPPLPLRGLDRRAHPGARHSLRSARHRRLNTSRTTFSIPTTPWAAVLTARDVAMGALVQPDRLHGHPPSDLPVGSTGTTHRRLSSCFRRPHFPPMNL